MLKFFPNGAHKTTIIKKYCAFNFTLTACNYDPLDGFNAHLLIGLYHNTEEIMSFTFSAYKEKEVMFTLNFMENSQVNISFNTTNIFYSLSVKISPDILGNLQQNVLKLYRNPHLQTTAKSMRNAGALLKDLVDCAASHQRIISASSGNMQKTVENVPTFIELLTSACGQELERLNSLEEREYPDELISHKI